MKHSVRTRFDDSKDGGVCEGLSAGAGFIVAICGEIMTMPGLPRVPSAEAICLNADGQIEGLF